MSRVVVPYGLLIALNLHLASACGGSGDGNAHAPRDAGVGHVDADVDHVESGVPDAPAVLAPGTCGVLRRFAAEGPFADANTAIRAPGAIVLNEMPVTAIDLGWAAVSDDGSHQRAFALTTAEFQRPIASLPLGQDPLAGDGVLVFWGDRETPAQQTQITAVIAVPLRSGAQSEPEHVLGDAFMRGTTVGAGTVSLDGMRGVVAIGHVATDHPHAFVIDPSAARVGEVVALTDTQNSPVFDCLDVIPTEHAAAVGIRDESTTEKTWRLIELAADAGIRRTLAFDEIACPSLVQLTRDGFLIGVQTTEGAFDVYAVHESDEVPAPIRVSLRHPERAPSWIGELAEGRVLVLERDVSGAAQMSQLMPDGTLMPIPGDLPQFWSVVRSEPGRLFVIGLKGEWGTPAAEHRDIYELGCGALDPAAI